MSKKLLVIIFFLIAVPTVLYFVAQATKTKTPASQITQTPTTPIPNAQTSLAFSPANYTLSSSSGSVDLLIDTGTNNASAVQLEISYDPKVLKNVAITPGGFFPQPIELLKKIDEAAGRITYAFGAALSDKGKTGKGTIAIITFTATLPKGQSTTLTILPQTLVTAEKEENSVLKEATNATITNL